MPTGYTAGILDGKINTFEEFATVCTRAFGATIHTINDPLDSPYEPRTPSEYYENSIISKRETLEGYKTLTDEELIKEFEDKMNEDLKYYKEKLEESSKNLEKLNSMLESAKSWVPPTEDHESFREFMIEQLESTIKADGDPSYYVNEIIEIEKQLSEGIDPKSERESAIKELERQISYYETEHQKELERCKQSNSWMESFFESIKK